MYDDVDVVDLVVDDVLKPFMLLIFFVVVVEYFHFLVKLVTPVTILKNMTRGVGGGEGGQDEI